MRRAVVTGIGLVTALGVGTQATWRGLLEGRTAVASIDRLTDSGLNCRLGAEVAEFDPGAFVKNRRNVRLMSRGDQFAFAAAGLALEDSGLQSSDLDPRRVGLYAGGSKEACDWEQIAAPFRAALGRRPLPDLQAFVREATSELAPLFYIAALPPASLFYISEAHGFMGPSTYFPGTADVGAVAIGTAFRTIRRGEADVVLAGGFDDPLNWWTLSKLDALELLTDRNDLGSAAFKPFDRGRTGSALGEGAAFLVVEELDRARRRGARIYAEVVGFGNSFDPAALLTPASDGAPVAQAITAAIAESGGVAGAVDLVVSHGSATRLGDLSEAAALRHVFGAGRTLATSVKPAVGHMVAAAGALNCAVAALALHEGAAPPILNLTEPDRDCSFSWLTETHRGRLEVAIAIARGIEGQVTALEMKGVEP